MTHKTEDDLSEYRMHLQTAEQKSQEDFDKTVLSLSGGALGISFVFLKDVIGPHPIINPTLLFVAWVAWGTSSFSVLASYYLSHLALRKAIKQIDTRTIRTERPGGWFTIATIVLNAVGAILFLVGVFAITLFANANLKSKELPNVSTQDSHAVTSATPNISGTTHPAISTSSDSTANQRGHGH